MRQRHKATGPASAPAGVMRLPVLAGFTTEILPVLLLLWTGIVIGFLATDREYLWPIGVWASVTLTMLWPVGRSRQQTAVWIDVALRGARRRRAWLALGLALPLVLAACQGQVSEPAPDPAPSASASSASVAAKDVVAENEYRQLVDQVMEGTGQLTRVISSIGIGLAAKPEDASEVRQTLEAVIGSLGLARESLEDAEPPPGYEESHQKLLDALSLYTRASAALLPDSQIGEANYWLFQELMLEGGKNFHAAGTDISNLSRLGN